MSPVQSVTDVPVHSPLPTRAVRLRNGNTLISDQYNHRVIEVNHGKQIVRTFGELGQLHFADLNGSNLVIASAIIAAVRLARCDSDTKYCNP